MAAIAGITGTVAWAYGGGNIDLNVRSWSIDLVADVHDTTDFSSSGDRTFIGGLRSWSGSFENLLDGTTTPLATGEVGSAAVSLVLTSSTGRTYTGDAICTGIHPSVSVDGINVVTVDFQGTGALALA